MVEEIGGGVPLTDEILPSEREYFPTASEHLFKNAEQIQENGVTTGSSIELYKVPEKHEFYLTNLHVSVMWITQNASASVGIIVIGKGGTYRQWNVRLGTPAGSSVWPSESLSISFPFPLKLFGGDAFRLGGNASFVAEGSILGYLVKKNVA